MTHSLFRAVCILSAFVFAVSCSDKNANDELSNGDGGAMPNFAIWTYSGEQIAEGAAPFKINLYFKEGIYAWIQYGEDLDTEGKYERQDLLWKMVDGIVYMYLDWKVYPDANRDLYIKGVILEDNHKLEVSWTNGLGRTWNSMASENGWPSKITLDLTYLWDAEGTIPLAIWGPWSTPGFAEEYGHSFRVFPDD